MGNVRCNKYWEANLPRDFHRPPEADMGALRVFITDKYVNKRYALKGYSESPCIENYMSHPFLVESAQEGGKINENNSTSVAGAGAVGVSNQQQAATTVAKPAAPVPQFDLLSLDDDPVPVSSTQQQQQQQQFLPSSITAAAPAPNTAAAAASDWDPFAAIAREPITINSASSNTIVSPPAPIVDPFAEIERTASSWSSGTAATSSSLGNTTTTTTTTAAAPVVVVDPFAIPPLPPQHTTAPIVPVKPSVLPSTVQQPPSMAMTSSGSLGGSAMRTSSANGHSKGNLSHEDILAMFDK